MKMCKTADQSQLITDKGNSVMGLLTPSITVVACDIQASCLPVNGSIENPLTCFYTREKSWGSLQGRQNLDLLASGEIDRQRVHTL